jgi:predicted amidophosphoribosyltransferase
MTGDPYKVCPECGGEYQVTATVCADCEVPLVAAEPLRSWLPSGPRSTTPGSAIASRARRTNGLPRTAAST